MYTPKAFKFTFLLASTVLLLLPGSQAQTVKFGQAISESQLSDFDLIAGPDGSGFPSGSGTAVTGKAVFELKCAACHATNGEGVSGNTRLVGGDMHSAGNPLRTVGSYWPHASTVFDFIRRAMPANAPKSLSNEEVYQVTAYVLFLNNIIEENTVLNKESLTQIQMPNKDGFVDLSHLH
ncbi:MAG: cytochrome c [Pseudohongiellaceae bacterium]|jgi:mono/diheme cytochrome c family protein